MSATDLLAHAQRILGRDETERLNSRLAAFLVRQALEDIVAQRCADVGAVAPYASARSRLLVLRAVDDQRAADTAASAWYRLSNACHVHAFEMQPSTAEIRQLCERVASLLP